VPPWADNSREALRGRVEANLHSHLASLSVCVSGALEPAATLRWVKAQLPNFVALGALTKAEASDWQARFARAEEAVRAPDGEVVGERTKARANELLAETIDGVGGDRDESELALARFHAFLAAFRALGAVRADEASSWRERVLRAIEQRMPEPRPSNRAWVARQCRRVVTGPSRRIGGVRLTCAELYEDCVMLRWHRLISPAELASTEDTAAPGKPNDSAAGRWGVKLELRDDIGTPYAAVDPLSEITGSREPLEKEEPSVLWGRSIFMPAVPNETSHLVAAYGADEFELDLR
jgi:hypothetical protein